MKILKISLLMVIILSGCAAIRENVVVREPTEGDMARIRVIMIDKPLANYRGVRAFPNSKCVNRRIPGNGTVVSKAPISFEKNLNGRAIGIPATSYSKNTDYTSAEFFATASQPIAFGYSSPPDGASNNGCGANLYFYPENNSDYELIFGYSGKCTFTINKLINTGKPMEFEKVTPFKTEECKP